MFVIANVVTSVAFLCSFLQFLETRSDCGCDLDYDLKLCFELAILYQCWSWVCFIGWFVSFSLPYAWTFCIDNNVFNPPLLVMAGWGIAWIRKKKCCFHLIYA